MAQASVLFPTPTERAVSTDSEHSETVAVVRHLSHELRQPLSTIETSAYYLKLILGNENPRVDKQLDRIDQMVHQMNNILSDVVYYLQSATPRPQWVDLTEMIDDAMLASSVQQAVEVDWTDTSDVPLVYLDPAHAQHMMRVLFETLRQVARTGEPILVSIYRLGEMATLELSCMAEPKILERAGDLFEPFTPHLPAGCGLALASVKRIAEAHQGTASIATSQDTLKIEIQLPTC